LLKKHPQVRVEIGGHTDSIGSSSYNLELSALRAQSVKSYLIEHGISPDRLTTRGYGESMPIASNATPAGRALNRRIEFRILSK
jgi:OOP family OmpA-OmpF porin